MKINIPNCHHASRGMTLIEVLITMIISSIMALAAGFILFHTQVSFFRATNKVQAEQDIRAMRTRVEYEIRSSTETVAGNGISIDSGFGRITYMSLPSKETHSISLANGQLILSKGSGRNEVLMNNVTGFFVSRMDPGKPNKFTFRIIRSAIYDNTTDARVNREFSFDVYTRNSDK